MENQRSDPVRYTIWTREDFDEFGNVLNTRRFFVFHGAKKGETIVMPKWMAEQLKASGVVEIEKPKQEEERK